MATHTLHQEKEIFYFVTFTCYKCLPLLDKSAIHIFPPNWISEINKRGVLVPTRKILAKIVSMSENQMIEITQGINPH